MKVQRSAPIDVAIADKNPLVLSGLKQLIGADPRFRLAATMSDGTSFLEAVRDQSFDVAVIGWEMPGKDGRAVLEAVRSIPNAPPIVVYTGTASERLPRTVMELGGAGFVSKSAPPEQLLTTLAQLADGQMVFPFIDVRRVNRDPTELLTARERELLGALASGANNAQIARDLDVTLHTIKFHLKNLYMKLEVANRTQAVALFMSAPQSRAGEPDPDRKSRF